MAAPNLVNVSAIYGKTAVQQVGTSATSIVTNSAGSNKVLKVNALYVSNVNGASTVSVTIDLYRGSTAYRISYLTNIPYGATIDVLSKAVYLEEGDSLRLAGASSNDIEAVCSYEEIA
jgi:hypothetical protein